MRCRRCSYALWNLRDRICPECGTPFRPSEFDLVPSSVQFCCKGCMQPYYGMTWRGHLDPIEFDCVRCGARVHMDECVVLPTEGVDERHVQQGHNPWLDSRRGLLSRFFGAIGEAMGNPTHMARGTPMDASLGQAFLFALLASTGFYAVCWLPMFLMSAVAGWAAIGQAAVSTGYFVLVAMVGAWIWALLAHAILRLTGKTAGTLRHTLLAIHYAAGANTLSAIICIGFMFGWIWWVVSASLMIAQMQRVGPLRAAAAGLVPPLACAVLVIVGYTWMTATLGTAMTVTGTGTGIGAAAPSAGALGSGATDQVIADVAARLRAMAQRNAGTPPAHPGELLAYREIPVSSLTAAGSATTDLTATIGGTPVRDLDLLPPGERLAAFQRAIARESDAQADPPAWRRLGDLVVPDLRGVTLDQAESNSLWAFVVAPDPQANPTLAPDRALIAVDFRGTLARIPSDGVAAALGEQNSARRSLGLPDLPDPRGVLHWRPVGP